MMNSSFSEFNYMKKLALTTWLTRRMRGDSIDYVSYILIKELMWTYFARDNLLAYWLSGGPRTRQGALNAGGGRGFVLSLSRVGVVCARGVI